MNCSKIKIWALFSGKIRILGIRMDLMHSKRVINEKRSILLKLALMKIMLNRKITGKMKRNRMISWVITVIAGCLCVNSYCNPIEMLKYGNFEEVNDGMPVGWDKGNAGIIGVTDKAFQGKHSGTFKVVPHEWGYCWFGTLKNAFGWDSPRPGVPVIPGATYQISLMAKGSGNIGFLLSMSSSNNWLGSIFSPEWPVVNEWRKYTFKFKIEDSRTRSILAGIKLSGLNAMADIDCVSMTFDPVENHGINPGFSTDIVKNNVSILIETSEADAVLSVNGELVPAKNHKYNFDLNEGYNTIAVEAAAKGTSPGIKISIPGHPEIDGCWRIGSPIGNEWRNFDFDDGKWPLSTIDKDGFMWPDRGTKKAAFRQIILWNKAHFGSNRCILPQIRNWGFSPGTVDTFTLALYSPRKKPLSSYEFVLDLPEGFRLLDITKHQQSVYNIAPEKVVMEKINLDNQEYSRYRLIYSVSRLDPIKTLCSLLPVKMDKDFKRNNTLKFYFNRKINGNIIELCQNIPVTVLPPVNGRQPKEIVIQQYITMIDGGEAEIEHMKEVVRQSGKAGLNSSVWRSDLGC